MMKYPMSKKTETPVFEWLVRDIMSMNYYLFSEFDKALKQAQSMSASKTRRILIYEPDFNTVTREWRMRNTFTVGYNGKVSYDRSALPELHIQFYVNAGEWLNPNQEWIDMIAEREEK